jgi:hypothetical protein
MGLFSKLTAALSLLSAHEPLPRASRGWGGAANATLPSAAPNPWSINRPLDNTVVLIGGDAEDRRAPHDTKRGPGRKHRYCPTHRRRPDDHPQTIHRGRSSSISKLQRLSRCGAK